MDITTAGGTSSLCGHPLSTEKTVLIVRHGLTSWNEQSRIQVSLTLLVCPSLVSPFCVTLLHIGMLHVQGTADEPDITPYGEEQAVRVRDALSRMHIDR